MTLATTTRHVLPPIVSAACRHRIATVLIGLALALACVFAASSRLGVTTDTSRMFSDSLPWKQRSDQLDRAFPQNNDLLVAVVDSDVPEIAEATAAGLDAALARDTVHFSRVTRPDALPYLQKNAFLLIPADQLEATLARTEDAQPFLGQLVADPSLRGLFGALGLVTEGVARGGVDLAGLTPAMAQFEHSLSATLAGHPRPLSWETLLGGKLAEQAGRFRFVLAKPKLDYGALEPGGDATAVLKAAIATLPDVQRNAAHVRITGSVALDDEEFSSVAQGAIWGLAGSFALVMVWLYLATRSWRLMVPVIATLVLGLILTTGFAAIAVGTLNLISVAFAVLFTGIAVDFAIQFSVRFRARMFNHPSMAEALRETGARSGAQILVAALATAAGFLAFTPTKFVGVAQLGVIAGVGMLIAFLCTLTFLPAMLALFHPPRAEMEVGFERGRALDRAVRRGRRPIVTVFAVLAVAGAAAIPMLRFDGDPLHTKNQQSEAVRTLHDLMDDPVTNPYTIEALLPSLDAARQIAPKLQHIPSVNDVLSLASFIPEDQDRKLAMITDAANLLGATIAAPPTDPPVSVADLRRAAAALGDRTAALGDKLPAGDPLRTIGEDARMLAKAPDATLLAANDALTRFLPDQLARLRLALTATKVTEADIPPDLRRDWVLPDGRARIQVTPNRSVRNGRALRKFVNGVSHVMPEAAGSAVWIVKSADTITAAFVTAALSALAAIAIILVLALRRPLDVALVIMPLLTSSLLTVLALFAFGMPLNFANIIALPLLLGVGVSFNIYFVMNWRSGNTRFLSSATARAVGFSALTTGTAFGSLALSAHPGTASMGELLLISLFCTVLTTMLLVPATIAMLPRPHVLLGGRR